MIDREKLNGQQLDIFVVNSFSSGFQVRATALYHFSCMLEGGPTLDVLIAPQRQGERMPCIHHMSLLSVRNTSK